MTNTTLKQLAIIGPTASGKSDLAIKIALKTDAYILSIDSLSIYKEMRYNTVKAVDDLREALIDMQKSLPGFTFTIVEDQGKFISGAIGMVQLASWCNLCAIEAILDQIVGIYWRYGQ